MKKSKQYAVCTIYARNAIQAYGPFSTRAAAKRFQQGHTGVIVELENTEEVELAHLTEKGYTNR